MSAPLVQPLRTSAGVGKAILRQSGAAAAAAPSAAVRSLTTNAAATATVRGLDARPTASMPIARVSAAPIATSLAHSHRCLHHAASVGRKDSERDGSWMEQGQVKYSELKPLTETPTGEITIIDVREPSETEQGMIPSAVNVPLSEFLPAFSEEADFERQYGFKRPGYDDKIIFYCRSGKRSEQALNEARKRGWWNVRNYTGSWLDWTAQEQARGQNDD